MTEIGHGRAVAVLLAALLAVIVLAAQEARAETVGTESFPGTPGAIAFASERDGADNFDVYRMNADGFGQTRLTDLSGLNLSPSWSANGAKIAFTNTAGFGAPGEVYQMGADGSS